LNTLIYPTFSGPTRRGRNPWLQGLPLAPKRAGTARAPATARRSERLREFITAVERRGELARVDDAHWDRELGAVTEVLYRQKVEKSPMLLFDRIPDYPKGFRCAYGMFGSPYRLSLVLGMEPALSDNRKEMLDHYRRHIRKGVKRIAPRMVKDGPALENILRGDQVDMLKFPVPIHHEDDGGRYIGTACGVVTRDPDSGRINVGTRVQAIRPDTCASYISNGKRGASTATST
jgi:4-hydroxy-3-polyprenylbenzoate decarboxylase